MSDQIISQIKMPDVDGNLNNDIYDIGAKWENITGKPEVYTKQEIDNMMSSIYKFKGSVATYNDLPSSDRAVVGDVYNVEADGYSYVWNGSNWEKVSTTFDLSGYQPLITNENKISSGLIDDTRNIDHKFITQTERMYWNSKYNRPSGGIPKTDLSASVQASLDKAETAAQSQIVIDSELIEESENPVQSQVIQEALNKKYNYVAGDLAQIDNYIKPNTIYFLDQISSIETPNYYKAGIIIPVRYVGNNNISQFLFTSDGELLMRKKRNGTWDENFNLTIENPENKVLEFDLREYSDPRSQAREQQYYTSLWSVKNFLRLYDRDVVQADFNNLSENIEDLSESVDNLLEEKADKSTTLAGYGITDAQAAINENNKLPSDLIDDTNQGHLFINQSERNIWNGKYKKPNKGIPITDLSQDIQASLNKADTALQVEEYTGTYSKPDDGIPLEDLSSEVTTLLNKADTAIQTQLTVDSEFVDDSENPVSSSAIQNALSNRVVFKNIPYNLLGTSTSLNSIYSVTANEQDIYDSGIALVTSSITNNLDRVQYLFTDKQIKARKKEAGNWDSFTTIATPIETGVLSNNNVQYLVDDVLTVDDNYSISGRYEISNGICTLSAEAEIAPNVNKVWYALPVPATRGAAAVGVGDSYRYSIDITDSDNLLLLKIARSSGPSTLSTMTTTSFTIVYKCQ